jgi:hypothetical protein
MQKRRITRTQVDSCLLKGVITEGPSLDQKGGWRCTMTRLAAGEEIELSVAIVLPRLLVITVY